MTSPDSMRLRYSSQTNYWRAADPALREFYRGRKVLVIGADGFLGTNCVEALKALDAEISIVTRRAQPRVADFPGIVFRGDIRDPSWSKRRWKGKRLSWIF